MLKKSREEILAINPVFSNHLMILQDDKYNPEYYKVMEGDEVFLEDQNMTVSISQEEADQINAEDLALYHDNKDHHKIDTAIQWFASEKLVPQEQESQSYLRALSDLFITLSHYYKDQQLLIMGDWPTPWLIQKGETKLAQEAFKYFKNYCKPTFSGGFIIDEEEIATLITHLFWLSRYNADLPDFLMSFEKGKTIFSVCKYGVLHIESYDADEHQDVMKSLKNMKLKKVTECQDPVKFE